MSTTRSAHNSKCSALSVSLIRNKRHNTRNKSHNQKMNTPCYYEYTIPHAHTHPHTRRITVLHVTVVAFFSDGGVILMVMVLAA